MPLLNLFRAAAIVYLVSFVVFGAVGRRVPEGEEITSTEDAVLIAASGSGLLFAGLLCWGGAIRFWIHRRSNGLASAMGVVVLVPLGFLLGWLYLLAARDITDR